MVTLTGATGLVRYLQVGVSIIMIGLSAKIASNKSSLSSLTNSINSLVEDSQISSNSSTSSLLSNSLSSLRDSITPEVVSIATSGFTTLSHSILGGIAPSLLGTNSKVGLLSAPRLITTFAESLGTNAEVAYLTTLSASEISSLSLWFSSFTYQTSKYGNWGCKSVSSLIDQYNISDSSTVEDLALILTNGGNTNYTDALYSLSNSSTYDEITELIDTVYNLTAQDVSVTNWNESSTQQKQQLLLDLSYDCSLKKANIAISFLGFFFFIISSGAVTTSAISLHINANNYNKSDMEINETDIVISEDREKVYKILSTSASLELFDDNTEYLSRSETDPPKRIITSKDDITTIEFKSNVSNGKLSTITQLYDLSEEYKMKKRLGLDTIDSKKLGQLRFSHAILFPQINRNIVGQEKMNFTTNYATYTY